LLTVAIIGAGPLGRRLALAAAKGGHRVFLEDVMPSNLHHAQEYIRRQYGPDGAPAVAFVSTIEDAVREADLVIDCVPDELESKLEIFCLLDRMAPPRTILATPTTRLSIADLASCTYRADRCVGLAVEASTLAEDAAGELLVRTPPQASAETIQLVRKFWQDLGYAPRFETDGGDVR
jgi:3-hydroxybutyryl-CoA dehydrogenase